jgi:AAA domain
MIRLMDLLETDNELPREFMERVRFLASTAHGFQGDERDLILFSLCAGPDLPEGSKMFLRENPNLFNVAVPRARAVLHVVGNRDWALGCGIMFIEKLARRTLGGQLDAGWRQENPYQSPWEERLAKALRLVGGQHGLKLGQPVPDLQHLQVFCTAHLGMLYIHAIVRKESVHSPSSSSVPSR